MPHPSFLVFTRRNSYRISFMADHDYNSKLENEILRLKYGKEQMNMV